jgi:hypothetical protein
MSEESIALLLAIGLAGYLLGRQIDTLSLALKQIIPDAGENRCQEAFERVTDYFEERKSHITAKMKNLPIEDDILLLMMIRRGNH